MGQEVGDRRPNPAILGVPLSSGSSVEKSHRVLATIAFMKRYLDLLGAN